MLALIAYMAISTLLRPAPPTFTLDLTSAGTCTLNGIKADVKARAGGALRAATVARLAADAGFPAEQIPIAVAVAKAESGWNPRATNVNTNGSTDWGLFQINDVNASVLAGGDKFDPADNTTMAFKIWTQWGNWNAWTTYKSGSYRKFLDEGLKVSDSPVCTPANSTKCAAPDGDLAKAKNGRVPGRYLCPLWADGRHRLRADAASTFDALSKAYARDFGHKPCITDSYRSLAQQKDVAARKPGLAAKPGTSNHGWGLALDLCDGAQNAGSRTDDWLHRNGPKYGWVHPSWAEPGGSKPEPWHWGFPTKDHPRP